MGDKEQVKPLAPASQRIQIEEEDDHDQAFPMEIKKYNHNNYIKCCGCFTAIILIKAMIILVLVFTVFRVKDPMIKMNYIEIEGLDVVIRANFRPVTNVTLSADISVKNSNVASFKFSNATTTLFYGGIIIGEAKTPPGRARARRTLRMNVTICVMVDQMLDVPRLGSDLRVGVLPMSSYTKISGKVKILNVIKKNVVVRMNCTMTVDMQRQSIQDQDCKHHVSL
ncbi:hypothetical protein ACH5RR_038382 [Cinchona calisaya]|uniref:Late embryogenesis abundant protein LEA-2 subgroup domain-containing protein n=1 Tax=Cinchona calisaya TaxID=153742 RepID=A0ABD2XV44_9GENT